MNNDVSCIENGRQRGKIFQQEIFIFRRGKEIIAMVAKKGVSKGVYYENG